MFSRLVYLCIFALGLAISAARAGELSGSSSNANPPQVAQASDEGKRAIKRFRLQSGIKAELFAAEPLLANPVAFCIDEHGRFYVAETFRLHAGVTDIRNHMDWLDEELASTSVGERVEYMKKHEGKNILRYTRQSDRVRRVWDKNDDGVADTASIFADGFNDISEGLGAGLLAYRGNIYYTDIPNLWLLRDQDKNGQSDSKRVLLTGFGVREGFLGHDLHGLRIGPDHKLYFTIGDRGAHVMSKERTLVANHEDGVVYRCGLDGSDLEIFARGLRNPQELAFDEFGNLWTGDNNSDGGDPARWVYVVEDGDSGWRVGYQFINNPSRGPWLSERMCYPYWKGQAAFIVPPIANIANGPSGVTYYPGVGLAPRYAGHFFLCDFRGTPSSGVHSFAVAPHGAGFDLIDRHEFVWELLATDCEFGYDGCFYVSDWVEGWNKTGKGRIYRFFDPKNVKDDAVAQVKRLFARGIDTMPLPQAVELLSHPDMRVRQEAQFSIVESGPASASTLLTQVLRTQTNRMARIHAVWGLGEIAKIYSLAVDTLNRAILDPDPEIRAQAAKVLGNNRVGEMRDITHLLVDESPRVRFFAAQCLGKIGQLESMTPIIEMLRADNGQDPYLRHAGVAALTRILGSTNSEPLEISAKKYLVFEDAISDPSDAVRMASLLTLRRMESPAVAQFLKDPNPLLVAEAARAINDLPITNALPALAALIEEAGKLAALSAGDREHPGPRDAILERVLNANYRVGESNNAVALALFALNNQVPERWRAVAVNMLGDWAKPSGRDRVTGLWRPLSWRESSVAAAALQPVMNPLQKSPSSDLRLAAVKAAGKLDIKGGFDPMDLLNDKTAPSAVRLEAFKSLAHQKDPRLPAAVKMALADSDERLRKEATSLQAQLAPTDALAQIRTTLDSGSIAEKQSALAALGTMTNSAADNILANWVDRMLQKTVPPELELDVLDAAGQRTNILVADKLEKFQRVRPGTDDMRLWHECLAGGDAEEGKKIFLERQDVACIRCHKVNGDGGEVGPELTGIGSRKPREYILESVVYPNKQIAVGYESVIVTLKGGSTYAGVIKSENAEVLEINSPEDGIVRVNKTEIKTRDRGLSAMPEELKQVLSKRDIRNLVEFLAGSKEAPKSAAPSIRPATNAPPATAPKAAPPAE